MKHTLKTVIYETDNHIATVLLNAAPYNIITMQLMSDLDETFSRLAKLPDLRAVVLSSNLPKIFCAGADIKQFSSWDSEAGMQHCGYGSNVYRHIAKFHKPVICALNGNAFGGGLEMALACDIRIFNERAKVSLPESSLSMQPGYGGTQRLTHLVGPSCAKKLMFTGQTVTAAEALRIGLADEVAAEGETLHMAQKMAETIAEKAPIAITTIKESVDFALSHSLEDGFAFETAGIGKLCGTMDKQEGAAAFIEKRKPVFRNH